MTRKSLHLLPALLAMNLAQPAHAQSAPPPAQSAGAPPPQIQAGEGVLVAGPTEPLSPFKHPGAPSDLSGVWRALARPSPVKAAVGTSGAARTIDGEPVPLTEAAAKIYWRRVELEQHGSPVVNTSDTCRPGLPMSIFSSFLSPFEIVQTDAKILVMPEAGDASWTIHLDRGHPARPELTYGGDWVGRFEGPTLVADGAGFNTLTWADAIGMPHSDQLHIIMRMTKVNGGTGLRIILTLEDPQTFTAPWTEAFTAEYRPDMTMYEVHCLENVRRENNENLIYEDVKAVPGVNF